MAVKLGPSSWFFSAYIVFVRFGVLNAVRGNVTVTCNKYKMVQRIDNS